MFVKCHSKHLEEHSWGVISRVSWPGAGDRDCEVVEFQVGHLEEKIGPLAAQSSEHGPNACHCMS